MQRTFRRAVSAVMLASLLLLAPMSAFANEYDSERAGHPLRVVGYVLHPIGVVIDTLVFRPAHWVISHEPLRAFFGHDESD